MNLNFINGNNSSWSLFPFNEEAEDDENNCTFESCLISGFNDTLDGSETYGCCLDITDFCRCTCEFLVDDGGGGGGDSGGDVEIKGLISVFSFSCIRSWFINLWMILLTLGI